jgi:hypothetical protein
MNLFSRMSIAWSHCRYGKFAKESFSARYDKFAKESFSAGKFPERIVDLGVVANCQVSKGTEWRQKHQF